MTIWCPVMFRDETDMLQMRLEETGGWALRTVVVESAVTHRGVQKPLHYLENEDRFMKVVDIDIKENKAAPKRADVELLVLTYVLLGGN